MATKTQRQPRTSISATPRPDIQDCIIVGGGPAGLTAALYLARFLRSVTVFDAQNGRTSLIPRTHNLGPFPDGISGYDLLGRMHAHAEQYGATIENCTVQEVKQQGALFHVTTDTRIALARTINFATGVFNHRPPLPKAAHDHGVATGLIRYCPVCDAYEVRNKQIAVLGKGGHAANEARFMRRYSPFVTLISPEGSVATTKQGIHVLESPMERLSLADSHLIVTLQSQATHRFDALYIALGTTPQSSLARGLRVQLSSEGHIAVDAKYRTSIDGAYAIGDVTEGLDQIAVAMSQGAIAATAIHNGFDETPAGGSDFVR